MTWGNDSRGKQLKDFCTEEQFTDMLDIVTSRELSEREAEFVFKMKERFGSYELNAYCSDKQWTWLNMIVRASS